MRDGGAPSYDGNAAYVFAAGVSAANLGDLEAANVALEKLKAMRTQAESGSPRYRSVWPRVRMKRRGPTRGSDVSLVSRSRRFRRSSGSWPTMPRGSRRPAG